MAQYKLDIEGVETSGPDLLTFVADMASFKDEVLGIFAKHGKKPENEQQWHSKQQMRILFSG